MTATYRPGECLQWVESGPYVRNWWKTDIRRLSRRTRLLQAPAVERGSIIVRSLWAGCLLIGGVNHARTLLQHGLFWGYGGAHPVSAAYWTSLTLFDPLAAALLFIRPRVGILATVVLIVTNVIHNLAATAHLAPAGELLMRASHPIILSQVGFMLFVVATAPIAWRGTVRSECRNAVPKT
jgi:hypothetical protein